MALELVFNLLWVRVKTTSIRCILHSGFLKQSFMKACRSISLIDHMRCFFFFLYNLATLGVQKGRVVPVETTLCVASETIASQWPSSDYTSCYKVPFISLFTFCPSFLFFPLTALYFHLLLVYIDFPWPFLPPLWLALGGTYIMLQKQNELWGLMGPDMFGWWWW